MLTWKELIEEVESDVDLESPAMVYDKAKGEFYSIGLIQFLEDDDLIDNDSVFIMIDTELC